MVRTRLLQNIHDLQADYREANRVIESCGLMPELLYSIWRELCRYDADDNPHKAVYIISRTRTLLDSFGENYHMVEAYNEAERKLREHDRRRDIENG